MPSGKEIRQQISSVKNTQKITKAMEMVAAAKMRRTQDRMMNTRPYIEKVGIVIAHLSRANPEYKHPFTIEREVKKVGIILISTDRGLCGGLNTNAFRKTARYVKSLQQQGKQTKFCIIGSKAQSFIASTGGDVLATTSHLGDNPRLEDVIGPINSMIAAYRDGVIDQLMMVQSKFENSITQTPQITQLFPATVSSDKQGDHLWDYLYEPEAKEVLDGLLLRYTEALVYQAVIENVACEMSARMVAMKNATDSAGTMIDELNLAYNKARQSAITQELSEIIGGASAV